MKNKVIMIVIFCFLFINCIPVSFVSASTETSTTNTLDLSEIQPVDLGALSGNVSWAYSINNEGQVVGSSYTWDGQVHAFIWQDGVMTDIGVLNNNGYDNIKYHNSTANSINDKGQVVGSTTIFSGERHAFLWENGAMNDLGTLGGDISFANAINNKGQIVGYSSTRLKYPYHAFLVQDGVMVDLGTLGGSISQANSINDKGQIVGYSYTANDEETHAFLWQDGVMTDLGTLGGYYSYACSINEKGQIVGRSTIANGETHAFLWQNGIMIDLGTIGGNYASANSINEKGQIIGRSFNEKGEAYTVLWQDGAKTVIRDPYSIFESINDNGQIVGRGYTKRRDSHACLWELPSTSTINAGWYLWTEGGAVASLTKDTTVYESSDNAAYRIDCTSKGSALTSIQLVASGLKVQEGKTYKLSFMAKSEAGNVEPRIALMQKSSPWSYYSKASTVTIGSEWKLYNVYFTSNKTDNNARLTFFLGNMMSEGGKIYFDSISFNDYSELLINPSFEKNTNYWTLWTANGSYAKGARDTENYDSSPAGYRIDCISKGTDITHIQLSTWGIKVNEGKRYRLTFRAKSEGGKATPVVKLIKRYSPWTIYAASKQMLIGSEWSTYEAYFNCNTTDNDARLDFFLGNNMSDGSKLYIDSISLVEVSK